MSIIKYNKPFVSGQEARFIQEAINANSFLDNGIFHSKLNEFFSKKYKNIPFFTPSCTSALELAATLMNFKPGDEVLLPSFTFSSTANAFLTMGASIQFVDIEEDSLNINIEDLKKKVSKKTKVICPVHYAGVPCQIDEVLDIGEASKSIVIEDAAQGIGVKHNEKYLGTIGDFGGISFHATKNLHCGEGGALFINNDQYLDRAHVVKDKGTNRRDFSLKKEEFYSWVDIGSSYSMSDISAAFLYAQLLNMDEVNSKRREIFTYYWNEINNLNMSHKVKLPPKSHKKITNGHIFYIIFEGNKQRENYIQFMKRNNVEVYFHYTPLHSSPMGKSLKVETELSVTDRVASSMIRLPVYPDLTNEEMRKVALLTKSYISKL